MGNIDAEILPRGKVTEAQILIRSFDNRFQLMGWLANQISA
jgi:hypothetical protein